MAQGTKEPKAENFIPPKKRRKSRLKTRTQDLTEDEFEQLNTLPKGTMARLQQVAQAIEEPDELGLDVQFDETDDLMSVPNLPEVVAQNPEQPRFVDVQRNLPRIPFLPEPGYRSFAANVPGDLGFDPLGLCTDVETYIKYREAELKHGRLSMIVALAFPLAESFEQKLEGAGDVYEYTSYADVSIDVLADFGGRLLPTDPFAGLSNPFVEIIIILIAIIGSLAELNRPEDAKPGDLRLDPLELEDWKAPAPLRKLLPVGRPWTPEAEVKHGRLAMVAVLFDVLDEIRTGNPVVEDTEYFFHYIDSQFVNPDFWLRNPLTLEVPASGIYPVGIL